MDYEVLMLSRIHEEWERTGDNTLAVANGLQKTGRLITGAAAIMVVVFSAFGLSSVVILKQIGFGLALAIFLDATIVRALVVPATMRLMGKANWWSPKWMDKLFPVKVNAKTIQLTINHSSYSSQSFESEPSNTKLPLQDVLSTRNHLHQFRQSNH